jgi:hypothetical protein
VSTLHSGGDARMRAGVMRGDEARIQAKSASKSEVVLVERPASLRSGTDHQPRDSGALTRLEELEDEARPTPSVTDLAVAPRVTRSRNLLDHVLDESMPDAPAWSRPECGGAMRAIGGTFRR